MKIFILIISFIWICNLNAQWKRISLPTDITIINDIQIVNDTIIYAVGVIDKFRYSDRKSYLLKSKDFGASWEMIRFPNNALEINKIDFLNDTMGIATGNLLGKNNSIILKTTNGGESWSIGWTTPDTLQTIVCDIKYVNKRICVAIVRCYYAGYSLYLISNNGGISYKPITLNVPGLSNITISSDSVCYISGGDGTKNFGDIFATNNWGLSFNKIETPEDDGGGISRNNLSFLTIDGRRIIIGGTNMLMDSFTPFLFETFNGGIFWERKNLNFIGSLNALARDSINDKYYLGYSTSTLEHNWIYKGFISKADLEFDSIRANKITNNDGTLYKICISGKIKIANIYTGILFFDSTYVVNVKKETLPKSFYLSQNYPNPFNPSTKIKYTIPNIGNENLCSVQLKIYDILGKEVATLVNKEQTAGSYKVEFNPSANGNGLTSGIYFYQLRAGSFIETKKMLLLR